MEQQKQQQQQQQQQEQEDKFIFERVLNIDKNYKKINILGTIGQKKAIMILEKNSFPQITNQNEFQNLFELQSQNKYHQNDIFSRFNTFFASPEIQKVDKCMVYPANQKLIQKYSFQQKTIIKETYLQYQEIWKPFINEKEVQNLQWVSNIIDGISEQEHIIYRDDQFLIAPNFDFQKTQDIKQLHVLAFTIDKELQSLRDLNGKHLQLLKHIQNKGLDCIEQKYGLNKNKVRVCLHYQPSYYWLHVHFVINDTYDNGLDCLRSHLLNSVIQNIELKSDYYQKVDLEYQLDCQHPLYQQLVSASKQQ